MWRRGMSDYTAITNVVSTKYDPITTAVGDIIIEILRDHPNIFSSQVRLVYNNIDEHARQQKRSVSMSCLFDRLPYISSFKGFKKSYIMKQLLINGVYQVDHGINRGRVCYKIHLTDRASLYDHVDESKRDYFANLYNDFFNNIKEEIKDAVQC